MPMVNASNAPRRLLPWPFLLLAGGCASTRLEDAPPAAMLCGDKLCDEAEYCQIDDCTDPGAEFGFGCYVPQSDGEQVCPTAYELDGIEACSPPSFNCQRACTQVATCLPLPQTCKLDGDCACLNDAECWVVNGVNCNDGGVYTCHTR